jgi:adenylate kinase family enzyme
MVLFGPPGVGKGFYTSFLEKDLLCKSFSPGEYFRNLIAKKV